MANRERVISNFKSTTRAVKSKWPLSFCQKVLQTNFFSSSFQCLFESVREPSDLCVASWTESAQSRCCSAVGLRRKICVLLSKSAIYDYVITYQHILAADGH